LWLKRNIKLHQTGKTHLLFFNWRILEKFSIAAFIIEESDLWHVKQAPTVKIFFCSLKLNGLAYSRVAELLFPFIKKPIHASSGRLSSFKIGNFG